LDWKHHQWLIIWPLHPLNIEQDIQKSSISWWAESYTL
jgi:hypothetical protein